MTTPAVGAALPGFLNENLVSILNGLAVGMLLFTMAVGLSLIFGLMDVLNLAHGAIFLLGGYVAYQVIVKEGQSWLVGVAVAVAFGAVAGLALGGILRPIRHRGHLDQALLTFGLAFVLADLATIFWGSDFQSIPSPVFLQRSVEVLGQFYPAYRLAVMGVGFALAVVVYLVVERTQVGAVLRAAVEDRAMVSALGINVGRVMLAVLALGTALAAFGGVIGAPILSLSPGVDAEVLILALIVIVIGGLGSIPGAFVGAIVIGQVQSLGIALVPQAAPFALFGAMVIVLAVRPEGLFGSR
ncbi:MAG: branched-chain amino acid ABC transporter permease [Gaiellaceae bacterium MAG52_C11]|nr:branched-chain amino acid ABC transporter permease [Candidatus Gaiellasilicea maunaloa]